MNIKIREYRKEDIFQSIKIWNEIVEGGIAFPQTETLDEISGDEFFKSQSFTGIAFDSDKRGFHIGESLVKHCMETAKELGFRILQFNAVVRTNEPALKLYKKLGFTQLGVIPEGFLMKDGSYEDIIPHYIVLKN